MRVEQKRVGLIVNPVAGMGGRVGLKGSDGEEILRRARELGATPTAPGRAVEALMGLEPFRDQIDMITYPAEMGEVEAQEAGLVPQVIGSIKTGCTTAEDTRRAAREIAAMNLDLLLFAGGDGTARDIYQAIGTCLPVVGIPAGVKIHSGVYAINPARAADLALMYLRGELRTLREVEVMDIDEDAFRQGHVSARLYGYLKVPHERRYTQGAKAASSGGEHEALAMEAIAEQVAETMEPDCLYIIGSGTTPRAIMKRLGLENTLLGIDAIQNGKVIASDLNEDQILDLIEGRKAKIIVTPIGGQGYIFGRGNQQLSPKVVRKIGVDNIIVVATLNKLTSLQRKPLLVDTGDKEVDDILRRYIRVVTGYREEMIYKVM
jgi:predicted polyphosphate/ATP-dependent NAD kinase